MISCRPASLDDIPHVVGLIDAHQLSVLVAQITLSPAATLLVHEVPVALAGLYEHADAREVWFATKGRLDPRTALPVIRMLQLLLQRVPDDKPVFARVLPDHETGLRLAAVLGFRGSADTGVLLLCRNSPRGPRKPMANKPAKAMTT